MKSIKSTLHRGGEGQNARREKFSNTYGQGCSCAWIQYQLDDVGCWPSLTGPDSPNLASFLLREVIAVLPTNDCLSERNIPFPLFHSSQSPSRHCQTIPNQMDRNKERFVYSKTPQVRTYIFSSLSKQVLT